MGLQREHGNLVAIKRQNIGLEITGGLFKAARGSRLYYHRLSHVPDESGKLSLSILWLTKCALSKFPALIAIPASMNLKGPEFLPHKVLIETNRGSFLMIVFTRSIPIA